MGAKKPVFPDKWVSCHFTSLSTFICANNSCILITILNQAVATLKCHSMAVAVLLAKEEPPLAPGDDAYRVLTL